MTIEGERENRDLHSTVAMYIVRHTRLRRSSASEIALVFMFKRRGRTIYHEAIHVRFLSTIMNVTSGADGSRPKIVVRSPSLLSLCTLFTRAELDMEVWWS